MTAVISAAASSSAFANPLLAEAGWLLETSQSRVVRSIRQFALDELIIPEGEYADTRLQLSRQPFVDLLLRAWENPRYRWFVTTGCVQSGKSLFGYILPGVYALCELVEPVILGAPTMDIGRDKYNKELRPTIAASRYRWILPTEGRGSRGGFSEEIVFRNGARLKFMSAHGGDEKRSSYTARIVVTTEVDKMDEAGAVSRETSPIDQICARALGYREERRRVYEECTVSIEQGEIWRRYQASTRTRIVCPCPHCGVYVAPERRHLLGWQEADSDMAAARRAYFACPACAAAITPDQRRSMNLRARAIHRGQRIDRRGRITGPHPDTDIFGFRWSAFHNVLSWTPGEIGRKEWLRLHREDNEEGAEKELCQFYWVVPYRPPAFDDEPLDVERVKRRFAERRYTKGLVPADAQWLTVGVDVHKFFSYWLAVAWRDGCRSLIVDYGTFEVPSSSMAEDRAILAALREFRDATVLEGWHTSDGAVHVPELVLVDSRYKGPEAVHPFCRDKASAGRFYPARGFGASQHRPGERTYRRPRKTTTSIRHIGTGYHIVWDGPNRVYVFHVDADHWKTFAHNALRTPAGQPGSMELYHSTDANEHISLVKQLAAEEPETVFIAHQGERVVWKRKSRANHALDCTHLACAAGHKLGVRLVKPDRPAAAGEKTRRVRRGITRPGAQSYLPKRN